METRETIKIKRRLDGLHGRLSDMMDDVNELQQDIQFLYRSVEKIYDIIISLGNPDLVLKSEDEEIQHRIDLYNKSKNLVLFLSPTKKEFEKEFGIKK